MFHGKNYAKRPGTEAVTLDGGWEAPLKMRFIQEALNNLYEGLRISKL
jgi:hypothetical protein